MRFSYDDALEFMEKYYKVVNTQAQEPETMHRIEKYYVPDLEIIPYVAGQARVFGRDQFVKLMSSHPSTHEKLTPEHIMIDERKKFVTVLLKTEVSDKVTGEILLTRMLVCMYQLTVDDNNKIKITKLIYFEEGVPPGTVQIEDIYGKEPGMAKMFSKSY